QHAVAVVAMTVALSAALMARRPIAKQRAAQALGQLPFHGKSGRLELVLLEGFKSERPGLALICIPECARPRLPVPARVIRLNRRRWRSLVHWRDHPGCPLRLAYPEPTASSHCPSPAPIAPVLRNPDSRPVSGRSQARGRPPPAADRRKPSIDRTPRI